MIAIAGRAAAPARAVFAGLCVALVGTRGGSFLPSLCSVVLYSVNSMIHLNISNVQDILCALHPQGVCIKT